MQNNWHDRLAKDRLAQHLVLHALEALVQEPGDERNHDTERKSPVQLAVLTGKEALGANGAPDNRRRPENVDFAA